ncbi:MAG: YggS family pyridoxal phosphate-dependent enzyme [Chloroflexi bacterium]|nr:MAG: YggS family pyridoxal phosphate-dependent enzyme [Phototrophicales bacterium]RMF82297.1 MAG: YggS family pyridoxal phosphate-dependent enzyme [Chloroflexota bacterium]
MTIADNIRRVQDTIADSCARSKRDPSDVMLVAVSKTKPVDVILDVLNAGLQHLGENRVEEASIKIPEVNRKASSRPVWHMIGHVQSRKAKKVLPLFDVIHSVDSIKLAKKLSSLVEENEDNIEKLDVLLEINISGEESKSGFAAFGWLQNAKRRDTLWQELDTALHLPGLNVRGLMTMAPIVDNMEQTRPIFAGLADLRDALVESFDVSLPDLSMGMTDDYPIAVEEGATIVRIGRAIFGPRE